MTGISPLISVQPEDLQFEFELEKQSYCDLKVFNNTEHHVAFKVKTTSPKYFVRPNTGVVQPWDSSTIRVTLQAQREYPPNMHCKDKFLLQSTVVPARMDLDELPQDTFNKESGKVVEERKLRVVYTYASAYGDSEDEALRSSKSSPETTSNQALLRLKEERDSAVWQTKQLQQELAIMKRRSSRSATGFSFKFAVLVGLIGIMVGFLFNFSQSSPSPDL